jgi:adenylate kinase family enzyme
VGSTGTGKTTYGRDLAVILDVPYVELDAINWGPNWTMLGADRFRARVQEIAGGDRWVVDGNYGGQGVRDIVWRAADTIIWLDYALAVIYPRLWRRTMARLRDGRELWPGTGNRETVRDAFFSRESLFLWVLKSYWTRKRNYPRLFELPQYAQATKLRFARPADAERWLDAQRTRAVTPS